MSSPGYSLLVVLVRMLMPGCRWTKQPSWSEMLPRAASPLPPAQFLPHNEQRIEDNTAATGQKDA